jgi:type IV pilus assembly protein PilA
MAANGWGCEVGTTQQTKYVAAITTSADGAVTATVQNISSSVDGSLVTLFPLASAGVAATYTGGSQTLYGWICGGTGTSVNTKYLPGSCRGV